MTTTDRPQFTALLDNSVLARLERLRISPRRRLTVRHRGEHLSGKGGTSTEFSDFRDYVPGDDVRYVDWNIFSRLNRPFIKQYRHEEEQHVVLLLDASASMQCDGKFDLARKLAAAFGVMGLLGNERVSVYSCRQEGEPFALLPPCGGRMSLRKLFTFLEQLDSSGGDFPVDAAVETVLRRHRGRGLIVILSDFLTFGEFERPLNLLFSAGLEVHALQILSEQELNPDLTGDIRLVDSESGEMLDVSAVGELAGLYQEHLHWLTSSLSAACQQRLGRCERVCATETVDSVVFERLRRKGWVR